MFSILAERLLLMVCHHTPMLISVIGLVRNRSRPSNMTPRFDFGLEQRNSFCIDDMR